MWFFDLIFCTEFNRIKRIQKTQKKSTKFICRSAFSSSFFLSFSLFFRFFFLDLFDGLRPNDLELGVMDFAGYQMLSDPNATMIADPTIEDSFRRDLN